MAKRIQDDIIYQMIVNGGGGGGITPTGTKEIAQNGLHDVAQYANAQVAVPPYGEGSVNISANGTVDVSGKASAVVAVPNSYDAGDEGKVVSSGALVSQTSKSVTANGTVDTTENNEVVVAVPNSYSASDEGKVVENGALVSQASQNITVNGTYDTTLKNEVVVAIDNPFLPSSGYRRLTIHPNYSPTRTGLNRLHVGNKASMSVADMDVEANESVLVVGTAQDGTVFGVWGTVWSINRLSDSELRITVVIAGSSVRVDTEQSLTLSQNNYTTHTFGATSVYTSIT